MVQHILCVDDEPAVLTVMSRMLERLGYRVSRFTDHNAALAAFQAQPADFDLLITDLSLFGASGIDFAKDILAVRPNLPVILNSGCLSAEDDHAARAAGITEFCIKPTPPKLIAEIVARVLTPDRIPVQ